MSLTRFIHVFTLTAFASIVVFGADHGTPQPARAYTAPEKIAVDHHTVLIVTHVATTWDSKKTVETANNTVIKQAKQGKVPLIFLQDDLDQTVYFCEEKNPNFIAKSGGGEFQFSVAPKTVLSTGGYHSYCHRSTMMDLLKQWSAKQENLNICQLTPAIYEATNSAFLPSDVRDKVGPVETKHATTTVPLSDILDLFKSDDARVEYFKERILDYGVAKTHPEFKVAIRYRGKTTVIQEGKGSSPFTLTYTFVHPKAGEPLNVKDCDN
jgi:hypothetical protein